MEITLASGLELALVRIPAGEFWMGAEFWSVQEEPRHRVILQEYWIGKYAVTAGQYAAFLRSSGYPARPIQLELPPGKANYPMVNVTWYEAQAFCRWAGGELAADGLFKGWQARLPGEAEWEKAARGVDGREYPWGNEPPDASRCNYAHNRDELTPVGHFSPLGDSPYGCADMAGNVYEWTHSLNWPYPYQAGDGRESEIDAGPRVVRGGAAYTYSGYLRCSSRVTNDPANSYTTRGFRFCLSPVHYGS